MTLQDSTPELFARFRLPPADLAQLSFCKNNRPAAVKSWAQSLRATQVGYTSVVLYKALPEIARLKTSADQRLEMLEALRPYVQDCIQGLAKHFINQPLMLSEAPLKSAVIAQALQKYMCSGYIAVLEALSRRARKSKQSDERLALACHRAITGYGLILLRNYQLYSQTPANLWLELHSLYWLAEQWGLLDQPVPDSLLQYSSSSTITQTYVRTLLLACARPNQMRQSDILAIYEVLESWAHLARVQQARGGSESLFLVSLSSDLAPLYRSRFARSPDDGIRELDTSALLTAFRRQGKLRSEAGGLRIPHTISSSLLEHLEQAWGSRQQRSFERQPGAANIEVCVGISSLHHHTAGGQDFSAFLGPTAAEESDSVSYGNDAWFVSGDRSDSRGAEEFPIHAISVANSSPGGYRLDWVERIPAQIKAGEVLGLRQPGRHRWGLGVIRWLQQGENCTRLGVQLIAPKADAYGAAVELPTGDFSDYRRVLMLPELKAANQSATLLTAFAPFREGQRVRLNRHGLTSVVTLQRRIFSTGSISQFTFRALINEDE
jgi:hypothetical protein